MKLEVSESQKTCITFYTRWSDFNFYKILKRFFLLVTYFPTNLVYPYSRGMKILYTVKYIFSGLQQLVELLK